MLSRLKNKLNTIPEGVKASVAYTVCSILQRCLSMVTMPLFTRILTQAQYGQYTLYSTWMNIFTIFITLNLAYGSFSKAMITFEKDRHGYVAAVQNITVALAGLFMVLYLPLRHIWNPLLELPTPIMLLMVSEIVFQCALLCWYGHRRFANKYKSVVIVTLGVALSAPLLAFVLVSTFEEKGYGRILGYSAVNIIAGLVFFVYYLIRGKGGMKKEYWKYALCFNIPLIPYYISQVIFNQSDIIMIEHLSGPHSKDNVAMYGVAYNLATLMTFVLNSINGSYVPWFYEKIRDKKGRDNRSMANGIAILMAFLLLAVIAIAPEFISIMADDGYEAAVWVVPPVAMSILLLFYAQLFINVEFYYEAKNMLVWGSIGSAAVNIGLNALLIPVFGFVAAGYTTLFSYLIFAATNYLAVRKIAKNQELPMDFFDMRSLVVIFLIFGGLSALAMSLYNLIWIRWSIIVAVLVALVIFHKKVITFVKSVLVRK